MDIKDNTDWNMLEQQAMREYNDKVLKWLTKLGEEMVRHARLDRAGGVHHFTDRTGNLRSSIGYVIVQYGKVVTSVFNGDTLPAEGYEKWHDAAKAQSNSILYAESVARTLDQGKTWLILVAGMEYAYYVEAKGFDVITGTGNWVEANTERFIADFQKYLISKVQ